MSSYKEHYLPDTLLVGLIVGPDVIHVAFGDDTQVNVATGAQIIEDSSRDSITHKLLGLFLLR